MLIDFSLSLYLFWTRLNTNFNAEQREGIATAHKLSEFRKMVKELEVKFIPYHEGHVLYNEVIFNGTEKVKVKAYFNFKSILTSAFVMCAYITLPRSLFFFLLSIFRRILT